jgi:hypothetical protein
MIEHKGMQIMSGLSILKGYSMLELGNQIMNLENVQDISAKEYLSKLFQIEHTSIDINGKDGALNYDLCKPFDLGKKFDIVTDFGTIEHTKKLYPVLKNVHNHCKVGGVMIHKNPKTGNFPEHGNHFFTVDFWKEYAKVTGCEVITIEEYAIYHNTIDGWEVIAVIRKKKDGFISEADFKPLLKHVYDK